MEFKRLTIKLEPKEETLVTFNSFKLALDELTTVLREIELEVSENKRSKLKWGVAELSLGSATIGLEDMSEEVSLAQRTATVLVEGMKELRTKKVRPQYFNDTALESVQRLARLSEDGVSQINIYSNIPDNQLYITEQIAVNVKDILEHLDYFGSVEGLLELISGRENQPLYFRVKDIVSGNAVRCYFNENTLGDALGAFRKRVVVSGIIQSDSSGNPTKIKVQELVIVPSEEQLPQPTTVRDKFKGSTYRSLFEKGVA